MRFALNLLLAIVVALGVGFGLSWLALSDTRPIGTLRLGPWTAWPSVGVARPDPYTRAHIARAGLLQLGAGEGLRFEATTDSAGEPLLADCTYRLEGFTPLTAFWTLVALDENGVNLARPDGPATLRSSRLARAANGAMIAHVGPALSPRDWLETVPASGPMLLALTLYDTSSFASFGSTIETLPAITRLACP